MNIIPISAFTDNYIWLLRGKNSSGCICVDPGAAAPVLDYLTKNHLSLETILLTHHHSDHIGGVQELLNYYPKVTIHAPRDSRIFARSEWVMNQEVFTLKDWTFHVLKTPGHTSTHICYYESNFGLLFSGDTLFSGGCGRVFDGTMELLFESLNLLKNLPENTKVYCGHEYTRQNLRFAATVEPHNIAIKNHYNLLTNNQIACSLPSTIGFEKQINPFFRTEEPEVEDYAKRKGCVSLDPLSIFRQIREDKDKF